MSSGPDNNSKVLLVISNDLFIRNYIQTDALDALKQRYQLTVIAYEGVTIREELNNLPSFRGYFNLDPEIFSLHEKFYKVLMWKYRKKSRSFKFRFLRLLGAQKLIYQGSLTKYFKSVLSFFYQNIFVDRWCLYSTFLSNPGPFKYVVKYLKINSIFDVSLSDKIASLHPDIILMPSNAFDPIGNEIIKIADSLSLKTLFLIDNWDNLSSKSILFFKPTFLAVWGEQSKQHAVQIHDYDPADVFIIGTPRFNSYYTLRFKDLESHFQYKYVLFVGCAIPFDETSALEMLDKEIQDNPTIYNGVKILYRPHPWRAKRSKEQQFLETNFHHVHIDPQVHRSYYTEIKNIESGTGFQPDISYYPSLLQNAQFVIGPLTTMLIESLIFNKDVLALVYDDKIHFTSPDKAFKYYIHFEKLTEIEQLQFCYDKTDLIRSFRKVFSESKKSESFNVIDNKLNYYIKSGDERYQDKLEQITSTCLAIV